MAYHQFQPYTGLSPYIDAYWTVTADHRELKTERILPDGCVDIILNPGTGFNNTWLVGTMTRFKEIVVLPETKLIGIRFKPAGFNAFYQYASLHEITDQTIEFEKRLSPDTAKTIQYSTDYLNRFFLDRLNKPSHSLLPIVADIENNKGQLDTVSLARRHFVTSRQLERYFKQYIGTTPKAFINLVRYQYSFQKIKNNHSGKSLSDIAFESGYYDHAHLANDIKKYTGKPPSEW